VGPEPPILREDEEVPAVKYALAMAAKKWEVKLWVDDGIVGAYGFTMEHSTGF
jgi:hypothetical protein